MLQIKNITALHNGQLMEDYGTNKESLVLCFATYFTYLAKIFSPKYFPAELQINSEMSPKQGRPRPGVF